MTFPATEQHGAVAVAAAPGRTGAGLTAPLRVDRSDPFFFDRPLDHVPDMLLVAGLLSPYRTDPPEITQGPAGSPARPVDRRLVHRVRPEQVMLGRPERIGSEYRFPVLPPVPGTLLSSPVGGGYRVEALIESGR